MRFYFSTKLGKEILAVKIRNGNGNAVPGKKTEMNSKFEVTVKDP